MADDYDQDRLEFLGKILVETELLSPEQWQTAYAKIAGPDPFTSVLDLLSRSHAAWSPPGNPSKALTDYQRRRIEKARESGNFSRLRQSLRWERKSKSTGLNQFLVLETLGKGGMGIVYKCWDLRRQMYVAIKRSKYENAKTVRKSIRIVRQRLRREAKIQGLLEHPNIARYIDFLEGATSDLLVLEYVDGKTLFELVGSRDFIPWKIVAGWAVALLDALEHAHGRNVIHRDIKPKNIILQKTSVGYVAKLLDMGLAKSIGDTAALGNTLGGELTANGLIIGTAAYMPPEQWASVSDANEASDIYSLGGTLFFALAGRVPFEAENAAGYCFAHTQSPPPSIHQIRSDVPGEFDLILQRMMAKDPAKRGVPGELRAAIEKLLQKERLGEKGESFPRKAGRKKAIAAPSTIGHHTSEDLENDQVESSWKPDSSAASGWDPVPSAQSAWDSQPVAQATPPSSPSSPKPADLPKRVSTLLVARLAWLSAAAFLKALFTPNNSPEFRALAGSARLRGHEFRQALFQWISALDSPFRNPVRLVIVAAMLMGFALLCLVIFGVWFGGFVASLASVALVVLATKRRLFGPMAAVLILAVAGGLLALVRWAL